MPGGLIRNILQRRTGAFWGGRLWLMMAALLLVSGGEKAGDEVMLEKARQSMDAGAVGFIFGRNVFQRSHDDSLRFVTQLKEILAKWVTP